MLMDACKVTDDDELKENTLQVWLEINAYKILNLHTLISSFN